MSESRLLLETPNTKKPSTCGRLFRRLGRRTSVRQLRLPAGLAFNRRALAVGRGTGRPGRQTFLLFSRAPQHGVDVVVLGPAQDVLAGDGSIWTVVLVLENQCANVLEK